MPEDNEPCLIIMLGAEIDIALTPRFPGSAFVHKDVYYVDQGFGDFTGFYDWLRNGEKRVIGVRYTPADELNFLRKAVMHLPYISTSLTTGSIEIYFSNDRCVEETFSDDQDFGNNSVYRSDMDRYALSFNADRIIGSLSDAVVHKCRQIEQ